MDQICLGHFRVILDPHITRLCPDVFYDHVKPPGWYVVLSIFDEPYWVVMSGQYGLGEIINIAQTGRDPAALAAETHPDDDLDAVRDP
jgi:hypothetical protein